MTSLRNPYALANDEIIHVDDFQWSMARKLKCPNCDNSLTYVSETKRGNSICRAHYRHNGDPCSNADYEKSVAKYKAIKEITQCRNLLENPNPDTSLDEIIKSMITIKPRIEKKCSVCSKSKWIDLSSGEWSLYEESKILVKLRSSEYFISFGEVSFGKKRRKIYNMVMDPSNPLVSKVDDFSPCDQCTGKFSNILNDENEERSLIRKEMLRSFSEIKLSFRAEIDNSTYFIRGKYVTRKLSDIWEVDREYFYRCSDICDQSEIWFSNKFGPDKIMIDLICHQLGIYYEYLHAKRTDKLEVRTAREMRDNLIETTRETLDRMANLDESFEDYLTCNFGKFKGISFYEMSSQYLQWLINEIALFQKFTKPQQFFIIDAYLSKSG